MSRPYVCVLPAVIVSLLVAAPAVYGQEAASEAKSSNGQTLDLMAGYWRHYFKLAPARFVSADPASPADPKRPCYQFVYSGHGGTSDLTLLFDSPPPPANWTASDFDDSPWPRQILPFLTGVNDPGVGGSSSHGVGAAYFRMPFFVKDPKQLKRLTLDIAYRGGVVVYVHGQEIARGQLPKGKIDADTPGESYPEQAYVLPPIDQDYAAGDVDPKASLHWNEKAGNEKAARPIMDLDGEFPWSGRTVGKGQVKGKNGAMTDWITLYAYRYVTITRPEWDKVRNLRDRKLQGIELPGNLLRAGLNVLALEIHRSDIHPIIQDKNRMGFNVGMEGGRWEYVSGFGWQHGKLLGAKMSCDPPDAVEPERRPAGVQVWADDLHRRYFGPEFAPARSSPTPIRIVGVRNGAFSAQVVVATQAALQGVKAQVGDLMSKAGGAKIPAACIQVRYAKGEPVDEMPYLGFDRSVPTWMDAVKNDYVDLALTRFAPPSARSSAQAKREAVQKLPFFDHLTEAPPASVPPDSCQPIFVTVAVPKDAAAGEYQGTLTVSAGDKPVAIPVKLQVLDWTLPDPKDFATVMALEQSPYGVARQYKVPFWSDEHFRLLESSFKLLGGIGNSYLIVPVLVKSEFGNGQDSMIRWTKAADGAYGCDFSAFDRYLDVAMKHQPVRLLCFVVCHTTDNGAFIKPQVVVQEASGKTALLDVPAPGSADAKAFWTPFVEGLRKRLEPRGLQKAWHWGYLWDCGDHAKTQGYVAGSIKLFATMVPGVGWARGTHHDVDYAGKGPFTLTASIYSLPSPVWKDKAGQAQISSRKGWKNPLMHLVLPRQLNTAITVFGLSAPYPYRLAPERSILAGARGLGRMGADYWSRTYMNEWQGGCQVGMPVCSMLWPGPNGAETSVRFECLREGVQEVEARIALERALEGDFGKTPEAAAVQRVLDQRVQETLLQPPSSDACRIAEYCAGWQQRSWDLYDATARTFGKKGATAEDRTRFFNEE